MSWHLVAGVPLPDPVSGHPALDFCNTRAGWGAPTPKEYLTGPRALALWVADAGLLPVAPEPAGPVDRALAFREALYRAALGGCDPADWALIGARAAAARTASLLGPGPDGARWRLDPRRADPADVALYAVAASAEDLLTGPLAGCVAACPGAGCGWLFADPRR